MAFHPTDLSTALVYWLDPTRGVTVEDAKHGRVNSWASQGGVTDAVTQAVDNGKPHYIADAYDGRPALDFDGTDNLTNGVGVGILNNQNRSCFALAYSYKNSAQQIWGLGKTIGVANMWGQGMDLHLGYSYNDTGLTSFGDVNLNTWQSTATTWDGTNLARYLNGSLLQTIANGRTYTTYDDGFTVGNWGNLDQPYDGLIAEVLVMDRLATSTEITNINNWLTRTLTSETPTLDTEASGGFTVNWTDNIGTEYVNIYTNTVNTFSSATQRARVIRGNGSAVITGLSASTAYYVWIVAEDNIGNRATESSSATTTTRAATVSAMTLGRTTIGDA